MGKFSFSSPHRASRWPVVPDTALTKEGPTSVHNCCLLSFTTPVQVEEFVVAAGADAQGVEGALNRVRDVSWAAGRTLRKKHVVLLAFAEVRSIFIVTHLRCAFHRPPSRELRTILCTRTRNRVISWAKSQKQAAWKQAVFEIFT